MKSYLKYIALFFGMLIAVISCQDDNLEQTQQKQLIPTIKTVKFENAGPIFNKLKQDLNIAPYLKSKDHMFEMATESSRTTTDTLGVTIYTDVIKEVTLGDYTSYTMLMATSQTDSTKFYNLTIEEKNGESNMFTAEYTPDEQWLNNQTQSFSGDIKIMHLPPESSGGGGGGLGGNPNLGAGVGGVGNSYSEEYPWDCQGTVIASTQTITHLCECVTPGHLPGQCTDCDNPGYYEHITVYTCEVNWDSTDPGGGNPNAGGGGSSSTNPNNPANNDNSVAAIVSPNEDCNMPNEDRAFDENNDCQLSPKEACKKAGYSDYICDCVGEGSTVEECSTDCEHLNAITNVPLIKTRLYQLRNSTSGGYEKGLKIVKNPTNNTYAPGPIIDSNSGAKYVYLPVHAYIAAIAHTHPNGSNGVYYKMYSAEDVLKMAEMATRVQSDSNSTVELTEITHMLVFKEGSINKTYALRFDDAMSVQNLQDIRSNKDSRNDFIDDLKEYYKSDYDYLNYTDETDIYKQQAHLFKLFEKYNLNISLYEANFKPNGTIDHWKKINKTTLNQEDNCN